MEITARIHNIPFKTTWYTSTFPPNVFFIHDGSEGALYDSGYGDEDSVKARLDFLKGRPDINLRYIILSHHHGDHASGAQQIRQATGAQIVIHPDEEKWLLDLEEREAPEDEEISPDRKEQMEHMRRFRKMAAEAVPDLRLQDGATLAVGGLTLEIVHTPGHTPGSVCLYVREEKAMLVGDTALGLGTVAISPPPHGSMTRYLESLERLKRYDSAVMLPGHGPAVYKVAHKLQEIIDHRHERERQVLRLLEEGHRTPKAIVKVIYPELDKRTVPSAIRQVEAHLTKLEEEGRVSKSEDGDWSLKG